MPRALSCNEAVPKTSGCIQEGFNTDAEASRVPEAMRNVRELDSNPILDAKFDALIEEINPRLRFAVSPDQEKLW